MIWYDILLLKICYSKENDMIKVFVDSYYTMLITYLLNILLLLRVFKIKDLLTHD